ncbi:restriction endonuclease subunit S [Deinococcus sp. UYEF24]
MMQTASTPQPRAFKVKFKDLTIWSVGGVRELQWAKPIEVLKPLSTVLIRKVESIKLQSNEIPLITIRFDGRISIREIGSKKFKGKLFKACAGDLVFSKIDLRNGAIGIVPENMSEIAVTNEFPVYQLNEKHVNTKYIQLLIKSEIFLRYINGSVSGASGRKRVTPENLEKIIVPLPSLDIQQAIVDLWHRGREQAQILDDKALLKEEHAAKIFKDTLGNFDTQIGERRPRLFVSSFLNTDRWGFDALLEAIRQRDRLDEIYFPIVRLEDVIDDLVNGWSPRCLARPAHEDEWGVLKLGAVSFGIYDETENKALPRHLIPIPRLAIEVGDVLISRANIMRLVGASVLVESSRPSLMLSDKIFRVNFRSNSPIDKAFLSEIMKIPFVRSQIERDATGTSPTMKNINKPSLLALKFPLPPLDIQREIVGQVIKARVEAERLRAEAQRMREETKVEVEARILGTHSIFMLS